MNNSELVSIIIPCWNKLEFTKLCISSLFETTSLVKTPHEIIVIDNGSKDGTTQYLKKLEEEKRIRVIYNPENKGYPVAINQGAAIAEGKYLCLLNNDCVMTQGWLEKLLRDLRGDTQLAAVGPYTSFSGGNHAVNEDVPKTQAALGEYAEKFSKPSKYVEFIVFFCSLVRREVWDEIGGLDEEFTPGNYEDNLFCYRVIEKGWRLKVSSCFVQHFGGATFGNKDSNTKENKYADLMSKNQRLFHRKIGKDTTISLCMIVADYEKPETLKKCLDSVYRWVDEINICFNYKIPLKNYLNYKKLLKLAESYKIYRDFLPVTTVKTRYIKFNNFSEARNESLEMATGKYIVWLDADDFLTTPQGLRDLALLYPKTDVFRCKIMSYTEIGTSEQIFHNRFFKNNPKYRFKNAVHEDITFSMNDEKAEILTSNITIEHFGYLDKKLQKTKNLRNYKLALRDMKSPDCHALTYFGFVNCLAIMGGKDNYQKAIEYIDEAFERFKLKDEDPLTPKLWVLRGQMCVRVGTAAAGKQSFQKAYDISKNPDAAVNLAESHILEKDFDRAIKVLEELYSREKFEMSNVPFDLREIETLMLSKLGDCYFTKADICLKTIENEKNKPSATESADEAARIANKPARELYVEYIQKAEKYYSECFVLDPDNLLIGDRLCQIFRNTGRMDQAGFFTCQLVNKFPGYFIGWKNLGDFEVMNKRYVTAKVFLEKALKLSPKHQETIHNLRMVEVLLSGKAKMK